MVRKWKWLIIEVVCLVALGLGWHRLSPIHNVSTLTILAIVFGMYGAGYAAARLDDRMKPVRIHIWVKNWKPHMEIMPLQNKTPEKSKAQC